MTEILIKSKERDRRQLAGVLFKEAMDRERLMLQSAFQKTRSNLQKFETRYRMTSNDFFDRYSKGQIDDRNDYVDWAGEYQILQSIQDQLNCLGELILCE